MQTLPNRQSPRANRYDYTSAGAYFVTICTQDHEEYFGKIVDGKMILNEIGNVCKQEIQRLNNRNTVDIHERIIMPNHVHLLLCMDERLHNESHPNDDETPNEPRRDALMARPNDNNEPRPNNENPMNPNNENPTNPNNENPMNPNNENPMNPNDENPMNPNNENPTNPNNENPMNPNNEPIPQRNPDDEPIPQRNPDDEPVK